MATIVAVHGTFAHAGDAPGSHPDEPRDLQWWQPGSAFERDMQQMLADEQGGPVTVDRFVWNGNNSEMARREAGQDLRQHLLGLEAAGEPYVVVGHSHGGSVVASALLASAARKQPLSGMRRWITVGTPFVSMRKERFLFTRLGLMSRVMLVASMMLFLMFLVYVVADLLSGDRSIFGRTFPGIPITIGAMMSLPIVVCYFAMYWIDSLGLTHYNSAMKERARKHFIGRWLPLTHVDDEAVQGLAFLPGAKLFFFDKSFAVPAITMASVLALPVLYCMILFSPSAMVGIGDWLRTTVYNSSANADAEMALRDLRKSLAEARRKGEMALQAVGSTDQQAMRRAYWREYAEKREELAQRYPNLRAAERSLRFKQRFFEDGGKPCPGEVICGGGQKLVINSGLLLHVVTDELSWALGAETLSAPTAEGSWWWRWLMPATLAVILVPLVFGAASLLLMVLVWGLAQLVSAGLAAMLNRLTNAEVKRAAFGNDTEGEIALGAVDRPVWADRTPVRLPLALCDLITNYSNGIASLSINKFRHAIGRLASAEPKHTADTAITTYFTWKELVHSAYFDVPEFRKLIAQAVSRQPGFSPSARFVSDPDYARTAQWLAHIEGAAATPDVPADTPPTAKDAGAVSAVVASTVKAEP